MKRLLLVFALLLPLLTACLGDVPSTGPISYGLEDRGSGEQNFVRTLVAPPVPGADPVGIVRGFLTAVASGEPDYATAKLFLTQSGQRSWNPVGEQRIVADRSQIWEYDSVRNPGLVTMTGELTGVLNLNGEYERRSGQRTEQFRLQLVDREWRIASLPQGVTLTRSDLNRTYRQVALYFPDQLKRHLVPISLYVPIRPGLPTSLVRALLVGPVGWLAPSLTTAFPKGSALSVDAVPINQGIASVELNATAATASSSDRTLMAAQLFYTLRQIQEFRSLSLLAGGTQLINRPTASTQLSLGQVQGDATVYFNSDRNLFSISATAPDSQPSGFVTAIPDYTDRFTSPALNSGRSTIVVKDPVGALTAGNVSKSGEGLQITDLVRVLKAQVPLTSAQFDLNENYWVGSVTSPWSLWVGRGTAEATKVQIPALTGVEAFAIARDGIRLVVSARNSGQSQVRAYRIVRTRNAVKAEAGPLLWTSRQPILAMRASGGEEIAALVDGTRIVTINLRDQRVATKLFTPKSVSLAVRPGRPYVIETDDRRILVWRGAKWVQLTTGRDPSYSG